MLDVKIDHRATLDGREAVVLTFTPKRDAEPKTREGRLARGFAGRSGSTSRHSRSRGSMRKRSTTCRSATACWRRLNEGATVDRDAGAGRHADILAAHVDSIRWGGRALLFAEADDRFRGRVVRLPEVRPLRLGLSLLFVLDLVLVRVSDRRSTSAASWRLPWPWWRYRRNPRLAIVQIVDGVDSTVRSLLDRALAACVPAARSSCRRAAAWAARAVRSSPNDRGCRAGPPERGRHRRRHHQPKPPGRGPPNPPPPPARRAAGRQSRRRPDAGRQSRRRAGAAGRTILARARLADREVAALERLRVELVDDLFGDRRARRTRRTRSRADVRSRDRPA